MVCVHPSVQQYNDKREIMPVLAILLFCLVFSSSLMASTLKERLTEVSQSQANAENVINQLQAKALTELNAEDYLVLSESFQRLNNRDAALDAANKAEGLANTPYLQAYSYYNKAQIHGIFFQNAQLALEHLQDAEQLLLTATDTQSLQLLGDIYHSFASAHNLLGQLNQGIPYALRSLQLARQLNEPRRELSALIINGRLLLQNNQYQQAFTYLQQGVELATTLQDFENLASLHFRLGMGFRKLNFHPEALDHFTKAAEGYRDLNRLSNFAYTMIYLAETYMEETVWQLDKADELLQEALNIAEQQQHVLRMAMVNYSLGRLAMLRQQPLLAEQNYQIALQQFRQINSATYIQETTIALVRLWHQLQRYAEADILLNELSPAMDQAATYLQVRYYSISALLAEARADWQSAYQFQQKVTELNQQELTEHIQEQLQQLRSGLSEHSSDVQLQAELIRLQQQVTEAERRQLLLQLLLVGLIFVTFIIWQLYRRRTVLQPQTLQLEPAQRQLNQFREKIKQHPQRAALQMLVLFPRYRAQLQRQFGQRCVMSLLKDVFEELDSTELIASYSGSEMLWLVCADQTAAQDVLQQALTTLQHKLQALGVEPAVMGLALPLAELLGDNWSKEDLVALYEVVWFGWYLAEQSNNQANSWSLRVSATHPRPCEWQADDLRADMLNAYQLGELNLHLNGESLKISFN